MNDQIENQGLVYDSVTLFGFGQASDEPLPEVKSGEIIIRYGGWSIRELYDKKLMQGFGDQCGEYDWSREKLPVDIYRLHVPVSSSNSKNAMEQEQLFTSGEQFAPVVLVATVLLSYRQTGGEDLKYFFRCKERTGVGSRVGLDMSGGRLFWRSFSDVYDNSNLWAASILTS